MTDPASTPPGPRRAVGGLFVRRERWTLSGRGLGVLAAVLLAAGLTAFFGVHPFLALTEPVHGPILVVEGWMPAYALQETAVDFRTGGYREIVTCGGTTHEDSGWRVGSTYADWGQQRLVRCGIPEALITPVPCHDLLRDRTYMTAIAVRDWLEKNRPDVTAVDVVTLGEHARRSRLLFQKALGSKYRVGIISIPDNDYDASHWWRSSDGARTAIGESIAYLYARLFFWPRAPAPNETP